jgi:tetratricopeptide (TPR) repeat protein
MQQATPATVLGDFEADPFDHFGEETRFVRSGDRYGVVAFGPDGEAEREVTHVFGVEPLQQLLVPLPGGRLQALNVAWDARDARAGGQRWFHLHADEPTPPGDVLHWAGPAQSWNAMCADCHSTALRTTYSLERDEFESTWAEVDVACEACHGPGSIHAEKARGGSPAAGVSSGLVVDLRNDAEWVFAAGAPIARRATPRTAQVELETCAPCHSRRSTLRERSTIGAPFLDGHRPALLAEGLYQADGQIEGEVYVWGSFVQSRMFASGVTCSDCHDPHSLAVADPPDATCRTCHRAEVFATSAHHHHAEDSTGASCVGCHMAARTYMGVDVRHDHSFRVPRPDLSVEIGATNACSDCHTDRPAAWAVEAAARWWGAPETTHFGVAIHAGRRGLPQADARLVALAGDSAQPAIARGTALALLRDPSQSAAASALATGLRDADPLVRLGALDLSERIDPRSRGVLVKPLLRDPLRAIRIEAARVLVDAPTEAWSPGDRRTFERGLAEYRASQLAHADQPTSHVNLATLASRSGDLAGARASYETALRVGPWFVPAYVNLADLERQEGREDEAEALLRRGLARAPGSPDLHHALGLSLVRQQRFDEALVELEQAATLAPEQPRYAYVYAVALNSVGRNADALAVLAAARELHPGDLELRNTESAFRQQ